MRPYGGGRTLSNSVQLPLPIDLPQGEIRTITSMSSSIVTLIYEASWCGCLLKRLLSCHKILSFMNDRWGLVIESLFQD